MRRTGLAVITLIATCALPGCDLGEDDPDPTTPDAIPGRGALERKGIVYPRAELLEPITDRERAPLCGREGVGEDFEVTAEPEARACLLSAWSTGSEAELETTVPTIEGPTPLIIVARADGTLDEYSNDPFGDGPLLRECGALEVDGKLVRAHDSIPANPAEELAAAECERSGSEP